MTDNFASKIFRQKIELGDRIIQDLDEKLLEPMKYNEGLLMQILADNQNTEYGKRYGFSEMQSIEEFQKKIPVTMYDDYAEYIDRMTDKGETDLICAYPIKHYNKSSGTLGIPKKIPMSAPSIEVFERYVSNHPYGLMGCELGSDWADHKSLQVTSCHEKMPTLPCGATYGALSALAMIIMRPQLERMYVSPDEAAFAPSNCDAKYIHARCALQYKELTNIQCSFFSFVVELLRYIRSNWEMLVEDIRTGTINTDVKMPEHVRESLLHKFEPMPERAEELKAVFENGGANTPFLKAVWPGMVCIVAIGTGSFHMYTEFVRKEFATDDIKFYQRGIAASEGTFSAPYALDSDESVLLPDSVFYEFLPLEAGDDFSQIVTMDQVETGKKYELVITNLSGFYRYRMRDVVEIVGKHRNTPSIHFLYRLDNTLSIMGEKTTEAALQMAAYEAAEEMDVELIDFSVWPDLEHSPVRYVFFMELGRVPKYFSPKELRFVLDQKLAIANPSMGEKIKSGTCGRSRINFLEDSTYVLYKELMIEKGTAPGQIKPVRVIRNEFQRKLFFSLTDYSTEYLV